MSMADGLYFEREVERNKERKRAEHLCALIESTDGQCPVYYIEDEIRELLAIVRREMG